MTDAETPRAVTLTRLFDAPIDLVFRVWTEAEHVVQWMKCDELATLTVENWVAVPGNAFTTHMVQPGVFDATSTGRFTAVDPPELLVFEYDANPGLGVGVMEVRVEFRALGEQTEVTLTQTGIPNDMIFGVITGGWTASTRQLGSYLESLDEGGKG